MANHPQDRHPGPAKHPICQTCDHFHALNPSCRKSPPEVFIVGTSKGPEIISAYPPVKPEQWCGGHSDFDKNVVLAEDTRIQ